MERIITTERNEINFSFDTISNLNLNLNSYETYVNIRTVNKLSFDNTALCGNSK